MIKDYFIRLYKKIYCYIGDGHKMKNYNEIKKQLENNKSILVKLFAAIDLKNKKGFMELLHPDHYVETSDGQKFRSPEEHWRMVEMHRASYPDMKHIPEEQYAEGNTVITKGRIIATNIGVIRGHKPTGKIINIPFINISKIKNNRVCGTFSLINTLEEKEQLGI